MDLTPEAAAGPLGVGQGVVVGSVSELTDAVYEAGNVAAEGVQGAATQTSQVMSSVESIFPEPSSTGIASQLSSLWSDLSTLATNPNQVGAEQAVVGAAAIAGHVHQWQLRPAESAGLVVAERGRIGCE